MAVHQLLSYARRGDAVTHQALALCDALGGPGRSRLIAHVHDHTVDDEFVPLRATDGRRPASVHDDDLVVYHVTIGCRPAVEWLLERPGPFGLVYHNITPHSFFEGLSWEHARLTEQGRDELAVLAPEAAVVVADSAFNATEVEALGGTVTAVHPPVETTRRLADVTDDPRLAADLRGRPDPDLLHIGQRLPHKRPHDLVFGLHLLVHHLRTDASLSLVGASPVRAYDRVLTDTIGSLAPQHCRRIGMVDDRELATRLRHARAFVTVSAHEGFCVPVVEAMAMGVPVLAADAGAVAETAGGAALLLPSDPAPTLIAEAMHALVTDDRLVAELGERGRRRAAEIEQAIDLERLAGVLARAH